MIQINPSKLLHSKWTAVNPENKEKHFIVTRLIRNDLDEVHLCEIEAVINKKIYIIDWKELKQSNSWRQGWK